jgi:hypothetical protein
LADDGAERTVDHLDVVLGDYYRGDCRRAGHALSSNCGSAYRPSVPSRTGSALGAPAIRRRRVVERRSVVILALVVGVGFAVLVEAG